MLVNEEFGLDWYDYGARNYDASLGRWMNIDPLAENFYDHSPFHMAGNNPIVFMDYNGKDYVLTIDLDTGTITISGTLYTAGGDVDVAEKAAKEWKKRSGGFDYTFKNEKGNKKSLTVNYAVNVQEVKLTRYSSTNSRNCFVR